ncbi:ethanolamine utilization protein EutJ [Desulfosporosinus sp. PR]|uniref:ethanolamine utilization protein EutJ n=1 Tax=Candidatus Desulfosporosinus nitrosoreducens TaxID=3401928 RepID=UPI0027F24167|nr:ethanolamine utilization protein EutJ [Desulfosporosinus sp. PR]MDQ7095280.1 ethanolamine utilization protein EutJ [Desulfosporosinus sp. PR]
MINLESADQIIREFKEKIDHPQPYEKKKKLFTGVDLGTAYIVLAVVDEDGNPVAGAMRFAQVVKDGLVVDYIGAVNIVRELKEKIENDLGVELLTAGIAYPPGTSKGDRKSICHVAEAVGFEVVTTLDEPTAANNVLKVTNGAVVDIGGGTTGTAILEGGKVTYVADEPTGGTHFSLVISGAYKIPFEEAEKLKLDITKHPELLPAIKPVIQKVASIVKCHIQGRKVETVYLVGGTSCFTNIDKIIETELGLPTIKPENPLLVTPLGIALGVKKVKE